MILLLWYFSVPPFAAHPNILTAIVSTPVQNQDVDCHLKSGLAPGRTRAEDYRLFSAAVLRVAETYYYDGRLEEAQRLLHSALAMTLEMGGTFNEERSKLLLKRGKLLAFTAILTDSGYAEALEALEEAEKIAEGPGVMVVRADALAYMGVAHLARVRNSGDNDYHTAADYFRKSLQMRLELGDCRGVAEAWNYLGLITLRGGKEAEARSFFRKSEKLAQTEGLDIERSYAVRNLGLIERKRGNLEEALSQLQASLDLRETAQFTIGLPSAYLSVGQVYFAKGEIDRSLEYFEKAYANALKLGIKRLVLACLLPIGDVYRSRGETEVALHYYGQVRDLAREIGFEGAAGLAEARMSHVPTEE